MDHSNNSQPSHVSSCRSQTPPAPSEDDLFFPAIEDVQALPQGEEEEDDDVFFDLVDDVVHDDFDDFLSEPAPTRARHSYSSSANKVTSVPFAYRSPPHESSVGTLEDEDDTSTIATNTDNTDTESIMSGATSTKSDTSVVSDELAKEMYELSMYERQRMMNEIHCVPDDVDDSPEAEARHLKELNDWIVQHYDTEEAAAYRKAESISKSFVESRRLRLQFLRAVMDYDIEKAGSRLFSHLTFKLELFGESKLCQERLSLDDLDKDDIEATKKGFYQALPVRDSGERGVVVLNCNSLEYTTLESAYRSMFYTIMAFYEDDDFQKKGIVVVSIGLQFGNNMRHLGFQFVKNFARLGFSTPTRAGGIHHCMAPGISGTLVSWLGSFLPPRARLRTRIHVGTMQENMTKLMSHGIPTQCIPILDEEGTADTQWQLEWMEMRKKIEARYKKQQEEEELKQQTDGNTNDKTDGATFTNANSITSGATNTTISVPSPKDILMGRGKRTMTAPGNIRLYMLLDDNFERYDSCARHLKSTVSQEIVDLVKAQGARFLEQVDGFWVQVADVKARNMVSHDFRTLRSSKLRVVAAP